MTEGHGGAITLCCGRRVTEAVAVPCRIGDGNGGGDGDSCNDGGTHVANAHLHATGIRMTISLRL